MPHCLVSYGVAQLLPSMRSKYSFWKYICAGSGVPMNFEL